VASVQEKFAKKILQIQGVKGFILVQKDGQILASKTDMATKPQTLAAMIILSGQDCNTLKAAMGFSHYHYLTVTQENIGKLLVFPIRNYFLGVVHQSQDHDPGVVRKIRQVIKGSVTMEDLKPSAFHRSPDMDILDAAP